MRFATSSTAQARVRSRAHLKNISPRVSARAKASRCGRQRCTVVIVDYVSQTMNDDHRFDVFHKSGPGEVTRLRGAKLETARKEALSIADSRRIMVYIRNQDTGEVESVQPNKPTTPAAPSEEPPKP